MSSHQPKLSPWDSLSFIFQRAATLSILFSLPTAVKLICHVLEDTGQRPEPCGSEKEHLVFTALRQHPPRAGQPHPLMPRGAAAMVKCAPMVGLQRAQGLGAQETPARYKRSANKPPALAPEGTVY